LVADGYYYVILINDYTQFGADILEPGFMALFISCGSLHLGFYRSYYCTDGNFIQPFLHDLIFSIECAK